MSVSDVHFEAFRSLREGVVVANRGGQILHVNPECEGLLGWAAGELVGQDLTVMIPDRMRAAHRAGLERLAETGEARLAGRPVRLRALCRDGSELEVEATISIVGTGHDVSYVATLRRAETADLDLDVEIESQAARALLKALSEHRRRDELIPAAAAAVGRALGWDAGALWTAPGPGDRLRCTTFWGEEDLDRFRAVCEATLLPPGADLPGRVWEEGRSLWVEDLATDVSFLRTHAARDVGLTSAFGLPLWAAGRFVGVLECFSRTPRRADLRVLAALAGVAELLGSVLDREQDQVERDRLFEQIHNERARLTAVLEQLPLGVVISEGDHQVVLTNEVAERMVGSPAALEDLVHKGSRSSSSEPVIDQEVRIEGPGGRPFVLSISATPVHDRRGQIVSRVTTLVDVTDRQAEQDRNALLARAGEIMSRSLEIEETLEAVARACVTRFADLCVIDLFDRPSVAFRRVAIVSSDPGREDSLRRLSVERPPQATSGRGVARVVRSGEPEVYLDVGPDALQEMAEDEAHRAQLAALDLRSVVIAPLVGRDQVLGAITFGSVGSGRHFAEADVALAVELARRGGLAVANAHLYTRMRETASALQASLVPPQLPDIDGLELGPRFIAGGEGLVVGGDFYDVYPLEDGRWSIIIGDVCGKGAEAAAVTARVRYTARALRECDSPVALLGKLNDILRPDAFTESRFCTVVHGVLEVRRDGVTATLASGGHPPPLILRCDGRVDEVACQGWLLGVFDESKHIQTEMALEPGDALVLFTDGVIEARSGDGPLLGDEGLHRALVAATGRTADQIAGAVATAVHEHAGGESSDDVAVLVVRVPRPEDPPQ